ncbi:MAG: lysylphosphatidylglycerol synthetase family protein [Caldilineaceae bacterium]|nr:lysylphosphatidylglycerol synthetase family protein [Caldilineaceae bacterium]
MRKSWLWWVVTLIFAWVLLTHLAELAELGETMVAGQWRWLLAAFGLQLLYYVAYTGVYQRAFATVDVQSSLWELVPVTYASLFANLAAPTGGMAGAALFVEEVARRGQSRTRATVGVLLMLVIDFGVLALIVLASLGILWRENELQAYETLAALILMLFVLGMAGALALGLWRPTWLRAGLDWLQQQINRIGQWFRRPQWLEANWSERNATEFQLAAQAIRTRPRHLLETAVVALVAHLIDLASLYLIFLAFAQPIGHGVLLVGYAMTVLFGIVSPTPNGIGVVEGLMPVIYTSLGLPLATATVISLTFRGFTFWLPMLAGFFFLRRLQLFSAAERSLAEREQPHLVAIATAVMGVINVLSGVLPGLAERIHLIANISPLEVRHGGHLTSVLAGFALLLLANGLWRRKATAWWLTLLLLVLSAVAHLVKGLDYEEALLATGLAVVLLTQRSHFHALSDPPSFWQGLRVLGWAFGFTLAYGALGFYLLDRHFQVQYSLNDALRQTVVMFTQFYDPGLHPITGFGRYFANSVYAIGAITLGYALLMLLQPVFIHRPANNSERRRATRIVEQYGHSSLARFVLLPDKLYFFSPGGSVIAYTTKGWICLALGDPIGPPTDLAATLSAFQHFCQRNDWTPVFYQTLPDYRDLYQAAGFELLCIGHEGIVHLDKFTTEGGANKNLRALTHRFERLGYQAIVHEPPLEPALLAQLRAISDEWLTMMHGHEQRFSLGWFDDDYIRHSQVMAIHGPGGAIVAFANIVPEYQRNEIAIDLMRRRRQMESGLMEFLFVAFLQWAKARGYATFNLGLSALAGVGEQASDPMMERGLNYIYEHINQFYNFKGLHEFKEKFHPEWSPRYLVYRNVGELPLALTALVRVSAGNDFVVDYLHSILTGASRLLPHLRAWLLRPRAPKPPPVTSSVTKSDPTDS